MDFLKKHYEKVILSVVLIGLVVAAALLPIAIQQEKQRLGAEVSPPQVPRELEPVNLATQRQLLSRLAGETSVTLTGEHNLFNPVTWQQRPDGTLVKVLPGDVGPSAVEVLAIHPLHLTLAFDTTSGTGYRVNVTRENAPNRTDRRQKTQYIKPGETNTIRYRPAGPYFNPELSNKLEFSFALREVQGDAEDPEALVIELVEEQKKVRIPKGQEVRQVEGYAADLRYAPEGKTWLDQREGDRLLFDGDTNNIVDITADEVVLSAVSNNKQTTLRLNSTPSQ